MRRPLTPIAWLVAIGVLVTAPSPADAHWCDDLWGSSYNVVVRPATDTVSVPATGTVTLDLWVQNNMGYPLKNFDLTAAATGYTIAISRDAPRVPGFLMPAEKLKHTLTISRAGGASLSVNTIDFYVTFGDGDQSRLYGDGGDPVMVKRTDGALFPGDPVPGLGTGNSQAVHLLYAAEADYGNLGEGLDALLQNYCSGRGSWDHSSDSVNTAYCADTSSTSCPARYTTFGTTKFDWQHLWAAGELAIRRDVLGARTAVLRERLVCGWDDANPAYMAFAGLVLGYLGEDGGARAFLEGKVGAADANEAAVAKAALLLFGDPADAATYHDDVVAALSSSSPYVAGVAAAALAIVDGDDAPVVDVLLPAVAWEQPEDVDNGAAFFAAHVLNLVAWDRRGWAPDAGDAGSVSFYGETGDPGPDTTPPAAPTAVACTAFPGGTVRVSWNPVAFDELGFPELPTEYRVYRGPAPRPGGVTRPGEGGFDYDHVDSTTLLFRDFPALPGTETVYFAVTAVDEVANASVYSAEVSCVPAYAPVAAITCSPTSGGAPLATTCNSGGSSDPNGAADIVTRAYSLNGGADSTVDPVSYDLPVGGHTVRLRVVDSTALQSVAFATIVVTGGGNAPPVADATADVSAGAPPLTVQFSSAGSSDPDVGQTISFAWDFRDGATSMDPNPAHEFTAPGVYEVLLTVTDDGTPPAASTDIVVVSVATNSPPDVTSASANPTFGPVPLAVHFDASGVYDPDGDPVTITWDPGDGSATSTLPAYDHTYDTAGTYTATLTATDGVPGNPPATRTFTILPGGTPPSNNPPDCATATVSPMSGGTPLTVTLDASGCTDPDGHGLRFLWRIPTSTTTEDTFATATAQYTFDEEGPVTIRLIVTDDAPAPRETTRAFDVVVGGPGGASWTGCACDVPAARRGGGGGALGALALGGLALLLGGAARLRRRGVAALAAAAVVLGGAAVATAEKRVVVLDFEGPQAAKAQAAVVKILDEVHLVIRAREYEAAQKRLRVKKPTDANVAKVATELRADAVVSGEVTRKGKKFTLVLKVRAGATGRVAETLTIRLKGKKVDARARREIAAELLPVVERLVATPEPKPRAEPADDPPPRRAPPPTTARAEEPVATPEPTVRKRTRRGDDGDDGGDPRATAADVAVGVSFVGRSLSFTYRDTLTDPQKPLGYAGAPVPGAVVSAELYPLAFGGGRGFAAGLGVALVFDRVLALKSHLGDEAYDTTQTRWGVGVRYRLLLGRRSTSPSLKLAAGYNALDFAIDTGAMPLERPNVAYRFIDAGLGVRFPFGPRLALGADVRYLVVSSAGDLTSAENYGGGSMAGVDVDAGLELRASRRLTVRGGVRFLRIAFDFDGSGADSERDGMPGADVGGAVDQYLGGYVTAGYVY